MAELIEILKSLSDETRFTIIKLLLSHDYCVGALAKNLNVSDSAVSQHLKILRHAGIIKGDKRGYYTHYYVDRQLLRESAKELADLSDIVQDSNSVCHKFGSKDHSCGRKEGVKNE
ncbi:MAG: metalloregulator ArsR/SmtB family transcription factor [Firmicutes bacterium]|nr:metalloregulator ArsR/SmtB family transcription factor [Bacillota bacterium]